MFSTLLISRDRCRLIDLLLERGFEGSSMSAVAKASGITAGAIYKHFKSKA